MPASVFYVTMPSPPLAAPPRVSIVMPSFNQRRYLETAIRSVLDQLPATGEFIVMDGGSTDGSVDVLHRFDDRITFWTSRHDGGAAAALQAGFARATGDVFGFLNADDFYLPGCLSSIVQWFHAHPTADVVSGHGRFATPDGALGPQVRSDRWDLRRFAHGACVLCQPATFFRREAFERAGGFGPQASLCWDMQLWLDMALGGADFHSISNELAAFRLHSHSITGSRDLRRQRVIDSKAVRRKALGRTHYPADLVWEWAFRLQKFASHPGLTLRQRLFFRQVLMRWVV